MNENEASGCCFYNFHFDAIRCFWCPWYQKITEKIISLIHFVVMFWILRLNRAIFDAENHSSWMQSSFGSYWHCNSNTTTTRTMELISIELLKIPRLQSTFSMKICFTEYYNPFSLICNINPINTSFFFLEWKIISECFGKDWLLHKRSALLWETWFLSCYFRFSQQNLISYNGLHITFVYISICIQKTAIFQRHFNWNIKSLRNTTKRN